ncbi:MAG: YegS/Rv2252/BmrU family lipid kinase [Symploca sp. SIO2G7]|nr:YegS/Rv2252/BmrU family lipid kinase [Symploca sp. SIO2G7]
MCRTAHLIFNPVSGQGNAQDDLDYLRSRLSQSLNLTVYETSPDQNAYVLAKQSVKQEVDLVIVSGGDGTINAAAAAMTQSSVPLAIIPRGTANAVATALDIPSSLEAACNIAINGGLHTIDTAYCNDRHMVLLAGIGLEADVVEQASRRAKDRFGTLAYVMSGIQRLNKLDTFSARLETDDKIITVSASAITVANVAPSTSVLAQGPAEIIANDGLLDVTILASAGIGDTLSASYELFRSAVSNQVAERDDIGYLRCRSICVTTEPPQKVVVDGEMAGTTPLSITCIPDSLTVAVPQQPIKAKVEDLNGLPDLTVELKHQI